MVDYKSDPDAILFYRRNEPYFEFTNFYHSPITYKGEIYKTVEHLFQASKFITNSTLPEMAVEIRKAKSPGEALRLATIYRPQQRSDWFDVNRSIMAQALNLKFTQHPELGELLEATGERMLVENSPKDSFWGIGANGQGRNELGQCLMRTRTLLRQQRVRQGKKVFISGGVTRAPMNDYVKQVTPPTTVERGKMLVKPEIVHLETAPPQVHVTDVM